MAERELPAPQNFEGRAAWAELVEHPVAGQHHRAGPRDRQHAERRDERRQIEIGDDQSIDEANEKSRAQADDHGGPPGVTSLQGETARDRHQSHDRPDREIDAAGRDHRRHAERHDADESEVAGDVVEVLRRRERGRLQVAHHEADDDERDRHPERLRAAIRCQRLCCWTPSTDSIETLACGGGLAASVDMASLKRREWRR